MGHQSTFSIARRIVPVLISLVLAGYLGFLLFSQYRSKNELEKFYLNGQMQDSEKHATALSYFFSERADDIVRLAESRELSLYFENKALGMSMEYGLSASLLDAKTAFNRFLEKRNLDNKAIYSRVIFLDASGQNLIEAGEESGADTNTTRKFFKSYVMKHAKTPVITAEGRDEDSIVTISFPYRFKGAYCGQIIAQIQLGTIYRQFVHQPDNKANQMIRMLLYQHTYIYSAALDGWEIDPENLQLPEKLEDNKRYQLITPGEKGVKHTINIYTTPIADTPFSLSTCVVEKEQSLSNSPKLWIIVTGSIGLIILFGAIVIIRTTLHNEVLNVRLNEIRIREKAIDEKNRSLQKLTAAVEQSANCVIITGTNGIIEYVNPYFSELTGVSTEEAVGNGLDILEPDSGSMDDFNKFCQAICEGLHWTGELMNRRKDGELYWVNLNVTPVKNEEREVLNCVAIAQDITGRKDYEEQIVRMNVELEQRVRERTTELESSNIMLGKAYHDLKAAQSQILQQEKMASIGQLAAGIAHEINNPVGFMLSNLGTMRKYVERLLGFIGLQSSATEALAEKTADAETVLNELKEQRKAMKIDHIGEDIGQLVSESIDGGERVKQIVQNLKSFARLDDVGWKKTDLNEGLDSTINIVWNELKYKATLKKVYGDIPKVNCNSGQLNQVFLNMLVNASQSIDKQGEITVRTWHDQESVYVAISDTGCGIPADALSHVFEPFFTTKDVGKGTGLGLSISYEIIKKHDGEIMVESEEAQGTTFTIKLPIAA